MLRVVFEEPIAALDERGNRNALRRRSLDLRDRAPEVVHDLAMGRSDEQAQRFVSSIPPG